MDGKKVNIGAIAGIVTILIIIALLVTWKLIPPQKQSDVVYTNNEYGFQLTLPSSWKDKYTTVDSGGNEIRFLLPTNDPEWQNSVKDVPGYVDLFGLKVWTKAEWADVVKTCENSDLPEPCDYRIIGTTSDYVFIWFHPQDQPSDFGQYYLGADPESLKESFKPLK